MPRRSIAASLGILIVSAARVSAHDVHELASEAMYRWTWEPFTVALLLLSAGVYAVGIRNLWERAGVGRGIRAWQAGAFAAGLLSLGIALVSPVAWLSEILFSVHMTQHEILMLISAPLLIFGHPLLAVLWAVPVSTRESWGRWSQQRAVAQTWRAITGALAVFLLHALAIWVWHIPALYEAALRNNGVHALE